MEKDSIFCLEDVSFSYDSSHCLLKDLHFSLQTGEKIGLYGPNGSGKTTLLRCITGLNPISHGKIFFHEKELSSDQDFRSLRLAVGFVLQSADDQLFFPTVLEDVAFGPLNLGMSEEAARERAIETLRDLGLQGFEDRLTHRLSGGEKKLVSLACVLAMKPEALLLDEPTTGLDRASQERLTEVLQGLSTARITISHNWDFLTQVSDRFCTIDEGTLSWKMPMHSHTHAHIHPLGDRPHSHED